MSLPNNDDNDRLDSPNLLSLTCQSSRSPTSRSLFSSRTRSNPNSLESLLLGGYNSGPTPTLTFPVLAGESFSTITSDGLRAELCSILSEALHLVDSSTSTPASTTTAEEHEARISSRNEPEVAATIDNVSASSGLEAGVAVTPGERRLRQQKRRRLDETDQSKPALQ